MNNNTIAKSSGFEKLDKWVEIWQQTLPKYFGYPFNEVSPLREFYEWYYANGINLMNLNNAGDPFTDTPWEVSSQVFEREVIEYFAPRYDFDPGNFWGLITHSGSDGNNHGIYFGANYLKHLTGLEPILYVSDEAHYSNMRLAHLQNLETRLVKSDNMGRMIAEELEAALDTSRPALMVYAMGSTFKGAIDDMPALNGVLARHPELPAVYRHVDAALFGGYLPFTEHRQLVSSKHMGFESIAVSGHKFFGIDSPSGLFLCTREVYDRQDNFNIPYLNKNMRMINCSRDPIQPLKFWWIVQRVGAEEWGRQASRILELTAYLKQQLDRIGHPAWVNDYSNTVFMRCPSPELAHQYQLAQNEDARFGGKLAHVVVMQHFTEENIDAFVAALANDRQTKE